MGEASAKKSGVSKVLLDVTEADYDLKIESLNDDLACHASITVHENGTAPAQDEMSIILSRLEITDTVSQKQLKLFCSRAAEGKNPQNMLLAEGLEPVAGKDGWFELCVSVGEEKAPLEEDEHGRIDYKAVQTFTNVEPGQLLGKIHPPTKGEKGFTITGAPIPPKDGQVVKLVGGAGVRFSDDGSEVYAEAAGRVVYENDKIAIAEEFVISGDVDLSVGNISFNGFVEIKGDVLDDFNIIASKGISVGGTVGACRLESDGPVTIGSMNGLGLGKVICKGNLEARYLNHATVECYGDVIIASEIRNSTVKSTGTVTIQQGNITGGQTIALEGIEAKIIGATSGLKTYVCSGVYFPETDRLAYLRDRKTTITYQRKRIGESLQALEQKPLDKMRSMLRSAIEMRIETLSNRKAAIEEEYERVTEELGEFQAEEHPTANPKINALGALKEGVIISLGDATEVNKLERRGPLSLIENTDKGGIRYLSYSPLSIAAAEDEVQSRKADAEEEAEQAAQE